MATVMDKSFLTEFGEVKEKKIFTIVVGKNGKIAYISKRSASLCDYKPEYSSNAKVYTTEEIKSRHLGKVKCLVKYKTAEELKEILIKYYQ